MNTFDQNGRPVSSDKRGVGGYAESTGAAIWEYLNPDQVQAEYRAEGKTPPSVDDIMQNASANVSQNVSDAAASAVNATQNLIKWAAIAAVAVVVFELLSRMPKGK